MSILDKLIVDIQKIGSGLEKDLEKVVSSVTDNADFKRAVKEFTEVFTMTAGEVPKTKSDDKTNTEAKPAKAFKYNLRLPAEIGTDLEDLQALRTLLVNIGPMRLITGVWVKCLLTPAENKDEGRYLINSYLGHDSDIDVSVPAAWITVEEV